VVPPLVRQTTHYVQNLPTNINNLKYQDSTVSRLIRRYELQDKIDDIRDDYASRLGDFSGPVINTAGRIGGTIVSIIVVLVMTFMMLVEGPIWIQKVIALQTESKREHTTKIFKKMYGVVTGYVNGQLLIAAIAATFAGIALLILSTLFKADINPIALAGIVFVFGLIPMFGNILAAIIVVLACLLTSLPLAVAMGIFFILYQQIENATLQPYIQSRSNQLTPLIVFIVALIGVGLAGIIGAIAAIPVAGCVKVLIDDFLKKKFPDYKPYNET
jgi:predicted PurR-regulated permease PerM